jgi:hypothetical protein
MAPPPLTTVNAPPPSNPPALVTLETPISIRVSAHGATRKFKLPLGDLNAQVLPGKVRSFLVWLLCLAVSLVGLSLHLVKLAVAVVGLTRLEDLGVSDDSEL